MRIKGKQVTPPKPVTVVLPRDDEPIIFQCGPVLDYTDFDNLVPEPKVPTRYIPRTGQTIEDTENATYKARRREWASKRWLYTVLKSLEYTDGLEWDSVDLKDPDTWHNYERELLESLPEPEVAAIVKGVMDANIPDEKRQQEALDRFMQSQEVQQVKYTSQPEEPENTPSGEPANA